MRIVITGATGNVGTALLRRLSDEPDIEVIGIARRTPRPDAGPPYQGVRWHALDLGDPACLKPLTELLAGVDAVVHLAWRIQPSHRRARLRRTNLGGTRHLLTAMLDAGIRKLVYASSVAAYSPGPKDRRVDESWPTTGVGSSGYSVDKAAVEALLDRYEREHPELLVTRLRKALVFQRDAGSEITRYFIGRLAPTSLLRTGRLPVIPRHRQLRGQVLHADDAAEAYLLALRSDLVGPFNLATEPVLDGPLLAEELGAMPVPTPMVALRLAVRAAWRARIVPTEPGWLDLTASAPIVDCSRARDELGWRPRHDARQTVHELLMGIATGAGTATAKLRPSRRAVHTGS
ncbi:NAD-dependent epimerase/dehydratase family protein [Solwaraspora sp. WMMD1047]|uniref:NAD-dependent epimerase/dehydratase family protein n=1 Tax=Solwaraspora sp. WMMD1047 TaxID=3016102 RepID=UPI0024165509|nr:NAD-dependent epimerase/dehydratase family protein [Solwaraspora sp. WMMD1047]MDG4827829.1 NAD-dependent epimerase/dehydratase family protein [Solwaraspora sp. WMMD1047]